MKKELSFLIYKIVLRIDLAFRSLKCFYDSIYKKYKNSEKFIVGDVVESIQ